MLEIKYFVFLRVVLSILYNVVLNNLYKLLNNVILWKLFRFAISMELCIKRINPGIFLLHFLPEFCYFLKKNFPNFHSWDSCKDDVKVGKGWVCFQCIYYRILSWLCQMHFPAIYGVTVKLFFLPQPWCCLQETLYWVWFFRYTSFTCLLTPYSKNLDTNLSETFSWTVFPVLVTIVYQRTSLFHLQCCHLQKLFCLFYFFHDNIIIQWVKVFKCFSFKCFSFFVIILYIVYLSLLLEAKFNKIVW